MTQTQDNKGRIVWGNPDAQKTPEVLSPTDVLLVDPKYFLNQIQTDAHLCNFLTLAAQLQFAKHSPQYAAVTEKIIERTGLKDVAEQLRQRIGTPELTNWQARDYLQKAGLKAKTIFRLSEFQQDNETVGAMLVRLLDEGLLPSILLETEGHAVLGIGHSQNKQELIAWDAFTGNGNPRLRRISTQQKGIGLMSAVEFDPHFKKA